MIHVTLSPERLYKISNNIKSARKSRGFSQSDLAQMIGLSTVYYAQIELGSKSPSLETLINIAEALSVSVDSLIYGTSSSASLASIMQALRKVPENKISKIEKILYTLISEFL